MLGMEKGNLLRRGWRRKSAKHLLMKVMKLISKSHLDVPNMMAKVGYVLLKVNVVLVGYRGVGVSVRCWG